MPLDGTAGRAVEIEASWPFPALGEGCVVLRKAGRMSAEPPECSGVRPGASPAAAAASAQCDRAVVAGAGPRCNPPPSQCRHGADVGGLRNASRGHHRQLSRPRSSRSRAGRFRPDIMPSLAMSVYTMAARGNARMRAGHVDRRQAARLQPSAIGHEAVAGIEAEDDPTRQGRSQRASSSADRSRRCPPRSGARRHRHRPGRLEPADAAAELARHTRAAPSGR